MATVKKTKALLDAEKKIVELENKLKTETSLKDSWYKQMTEAKEELDGMHLILDDLGIKGYKDEGKYYRIPLSVRLFSWAMRLQTK